MKKKDFKEAYKLFSQEWLDCNECGYFFPYGDEVEISNSEVIYYNKMYENDDKKDIELLCPYIDLEQYIRVDVWKNPIILVPYTIAKQIIPIIEFNRECYQIWKDENNNAIVFAKIPSSTPFIQNRKKCDQWSISNAVVSQTQNTYLSKEWDKFYDSFKTLNTKIKRKCYLYLT